MKQVTIADVARQAGVSIATVSRVLNHNPNVNKDLCRRVNEVIEQMGYVPNIHARSIRAAQSGLLGIIIPTAKNAFFAEILEGAMDAAIDSNVKMLAFSSNGSDERDIACLKAVASSSVDGLIYCPVSVASSSQFRAIISTNLPVVIAARRNVIKGLPHIYLDNVKGGYLATKYLLKQGHKHIAFFCGFWQNPASSVDELLVMMDKEQRGAYSSLDRMEGYLKALEECGTEFDKSLITMTGYDFDSGYRCTKEFLSTLTDFDAVICGNDWVASGALQALREQNILVPDQVSVIGYDDGAVAKIARPMLTSVHQSPYTIGYSAVEMLQDMIDGKLVEDKIIDTTLTVRNSTAAKRG